MHDLLVGDWYAVQPYNLQGDNCKWTNLYTSIIGPFYEAIHTSTSQCYHPYTWQTADVVHVGLYYMSYYIKYYMSVAYADSSHCTVRLQMRHSTCIQLHVAVHGITVPHTYSMPRHTFPLYYLHDTVTINVHNKSDTA